jgi:hypothetical protein
MPTPCSPDPGWLLTLWEQGLHANRRQRDDALLAHAGQAAAPQALGQRQAGLLAAHAQWFGPALALHSTCPACAQALAWEVDSAALAQSLRQMPGATAAPPLDHPAGRLHLRAPQVDDLDRAVAAGPLAYADTLLAACVARWQPEPGPAAPPPLPAPGEWPAELRSAALAQLEALDPAASVSFALDCPACGQAWVAPLDPGAALWRKVQAAAERLLQEIDLLARAYGWREPDILALGPLRRAAYLQLVQA